MSTEFRFYVQLHDGKALDVWRPLRLTGLLAAVIVNGVENSMRGLVAAALPHVPSAQSIPARGGIRGADQAHHESSKQANADPGDDDTSR